MYAGILTIDHDIAIPLFHNLTPTSATDQVEFLVSKGYDVYTFEQMLAHTPGTEARGCPACIVAIEENLRRIKDRHDYDRKRRLPAGSPSQGAEPPALLADPPTPTPPRQQPLQPRPRSGKRSRQALST